MRAMKKMVAFANMTKGMMKVTGRKEDGAWGWKTWDMDE